MSTLTPYKSYFADWKGKRPTVKELRLVRDLHLAREGSKAALAVALALMPEGTDQPTIKAHLGQPFRNKIRDISQGHNVKLLRRKHGNVVNIRLIPKAA